MLLLAASVSRFAIAQDAGKVEPSGWLGVSGAVEVRPSLEVMLGTQLRTDLLVDGDSGVFTTAGVAVLPSEVWQLSLGYRSELSLVGSAPAHRVALDGHVRRERGEVRLALRQRYTLGVERGVPEHTLRTRAGLHWRRAGLMPYLEIEPYLTVAPAPGLERVRLTLGVGVDTQGPDWTLYLHMEHHGDGDLRAILALDVSLSGALREQ